MTTITLSAWVFGDEITPVNIVGVSITFMGSSDYPRSRTARTNNNSAGNLGIALFTHHKYQKSVHSTVPLDAHGNPLGSDEEEGEIVEATELFDEVSRSRNASTH